MFHTRNLSQTRHKFQVTTVDDGHNFVIEFSRLCVCVCVQHFVCFPRE